MIPNWVLPGRQPIGDECVPQPRSVSPLTCKLENVDDDPGAGQSKVERETWQQSECGTRDQSRKKERETNHSRDQKGSKKGENERSAKAVSYTHLTLPTILRV